MQTLSDKTKTYRARLEKEEASKKQQLKIMKRTHEAYVQEKETLIRNLEEIADEQEQRITLLETQGM